MKKFIIPCVLIITAILVYSFHFKDNGPQFKTADKNQSPSNKLKVNRNYSRLPMHFEQNQGQVAGEVKFLSRGSGYTLFLTSNEAVLSLRKPEIVNRESGHKLPTEKMISENPKSENLPPSDNCVSNRAGPKSTTLRMRLVGANPEPEVKGVDKLPGKSNYFRGNDPARWQTNVRNYAKVQYKQVYPGIDLIYYGSQRQLEYDFVITPGADPSVISLDFEGIENKKIDSKGNLVLKLENTELVLRAPLIFQEVNGAKHPVKGGYILSQLGRVGFDVDKYDRHYPLVIDPIVDLFSTYLGGSDMDRMFMGDVEVDLAGNIYLLGESRSDDFPLANRPFDPEGWAFVSKFDSQWNLLFTTFFPASPWQMGMDVDGAGNIYLVGYTGSNVFPTVNAFQDSVSGSTSLDAFFLKLNSNGNSLLYSTYFGGGDHEGFASHDADIAVDALGNAYIVGNTMPAIGGDPFPVTDNAFQKHAGGYYIQGFVAKFDPTKSGKSSLIYSTYLGGNGDSELHAITVDNMGNAHVTGWTEASTFPTKNAFQPNRNGKGDMIITKLNAEGSDLIFSTYLGGIGRTDRGRDIKLDAANNIFIVGHATREFPITPGAFSEQNSVISASVVASLNSAGALIAASLVPINVSALDIDAAGNIYIAGSKAVFTGPGTYVKSAAVWTMKTDLSDTLYTAVFGGSGNDEAEAIALKPDGTVYVVGTTQSTDFPLANPFQSELKGNSDAFILSFRFQRDIPLIYDQVVQGGPPVFTQTPSTPQHILPQFFLSSPQDTVVFRFEGRSTDGKVALRVLNTRVTGINFPPLNLDVRIFDPDSGEMTPYTLPNLGTGNAGKQFNVTKNGAYLIQVFTRAGSPGPFPAPFQIHLAGNVGLLRKLVNGVPEVPRATRLDILFNHPAPRPQGIFGSADTVAQTALFKFANPVEISQFAVAVIVPPPSSPTGFPPNSAMIRAPDPMKPLGITTPTARTPVCEGLDPTGMVVDFTQIPDPAEPGVNAPSVAGTVCAVIGQNDGTSVTLPLAGGVTSLIFDMGSGQEIVDGDGADFKVFSSTGSYQVAASNTPYSGTFVFLNGSFTGTQSFDLAGTGLTSARYVLVSTASTVTLDAVNALNVFIDAVVQDPTSGSTIPVEDVGFGTITMRRAKAPETGLDPFLELIAPDGSRFGQNESGFGDKTSQDLSDAALVNIDLTQSGFYRFLGRGYDQSPGNQSSGAFFVRLESGGVYDQQDIVVSDQDENALGAQKTGTISQTRQRDSYLFQWHPGQPVNVVVNARDSNVDALVELYDPEDFLIAANDNFVGRGKDPVLQVTLPGNSFNGKEALPDPSTYRIVVSAIDTINTNKVPVSLSMGKGHFRAVKGGSYEVKVFTGALSGGEPVKPTVIGITPDIAVQGAAHVVLTITGSNFAEGAAVAFSGTGITVTSVNFISTSEIKVTVDVAETAQTGLRDVIVNNPGGLSGAGAGMFEIRESLGTVTLQWDAPPSGETLAPPANLALQFDGGQGAATVHPIPGRMPIQAGRSFPRGNCKQFSNTGFGRVGKRGSTKNRPGWIKLQTLQQLEELSNGVPVTRTVGEAEVQEFFINVPVEAAQLKFETSNSTGDPELFVSFGSAPDPVNGIFDFSSENSAPEEELIIVDQITLPSIQAGQWFVSVLGFTASTYTLTATYSRPEALSNGVPVTRTIQQDELQEFFIPVPADATTLTIATRHSTGDPDLFVRWGSQVDLVNSIFDFSSETVGSGEESITVDQGTDPVLHAGDWFVAVLEFESGQQTYTLTATHNGTGSAAQVLGYNIYRSSSANARSTGTLVKRIDAGVTTFTEPVPNTGTFFYQVTAVYDQGESAPSNDASVVVTRVEEGQPDLIPVAFALKQNYPNPFNPETRILYKLSQSTHVRLEIFNLLGQKIRTLMDEPKPAGSYSVVWDGRRDNGEAVASGVYIYRLKTGQFEKSRKLIVR